MSLVQISLIHFTVALLLTTRIRAQQYEGDSCTLANGETGKCAILKDCDSVYQKLLDGVTPDTLCGFSGYTPIVCCPNTINAVTPSPSTTTDTPEFLVTSTSSSTVTSRSDNNGTPGDLARRKCAEYASSVYILEYPPILINNQKPVNQSLCAVKSRKLIVGGTKADPKEFPYMAAVGFDSKMDDKIRWLCGGSLVSDRFVMTAAHCTHSLQYGKATWVRLGDLNLAKTDDDANPQQHRVIERFRHPSYRRPAEYHDIALLKLESAVTFDAYTRPACLPTSRRIENEEVVATGWGHVSWEDDEGSDHLLKVTLPTVPQKRCNDSFFAGGNSDYKLNRGIIDRFQICAGKEGKDTCQGDSGGPIAVFNLDHDCMYDVVGITSLGRLCGSILPGVYTRVFNYISWLENTIWG